MRKGTRLLGEKIRSCYSSNRQSNDCADTKPSPEQCEYDNVAQAAGSLTILLAAAEAAGLTGTLQDPTFAGTILAPSNEAFNAAFSSLGVSQQEFLSNSALVARVLSNHSKCFLLCSVDCDVL